MSAQSIRSAYRSVLREIRLSRPANPIHPPSPAVRHSLKTLFATPRPNESDETIAREAENLVLFLQSQREYGELLKRYNPLHDMSADEHRTATANRVGLNMPLPVLQ